MAAFSIFMLREPSFYIGRDPRINAFVHAFQKVNEIRHNYFNPAKGKYSGPKEI
jgi:hypothetical protein